MVNFHIVVPSAAAAVLSVGVVTRKRGDLAEGDGVMSLIVALAGAVLRVAVAWGGGEEDEAVGVDVDAGGLNGKGIVCVTDKDDDRDERIWRTVVEI